MKIIFWGLCALLTTQVFANPQFSEASPVFNSRYEIDGAALCATAEQTLAYLNKGTQYDPQVIHPGKMLPIPLSQVKATLRFICQHQAELNNPAFIRQHFKFIRWQPDLIKARQLAANKPLLKNLPNDQILMTKYYVHLAKGSIKSTAGRSCPLYGLPKDEQALTLEEADLKPDLMRYKYGKQAILAGALEHQDVPVLAYLSRDDLESALLQGTVVVDFGGKTGQKIFNVHRCNNIPYDRLKNPYQQERYWYFKQVEGIKGYGKDADHKITVNTKATFAADLTQFGLGKLLMVQYPTRSGALMTRMGVLADTGGAFVDNQYQVDYLAGSYPGKEAFHRGTQQLPDYVDAYFMLLK